MDDLAPGPFASVPAPTEALREECLDQRPWIIIKVAGVGAPLENVALCFYTTSLPQQPRLPLKLSFTRLTPHF